MQALADEGCGRALGGLRRLPASACHLGALARQVFAQFPGYEEILGSFPGLRGGGEILFGVGVEARFLSALGWRTRLRPGPLQSGRPGGEAVEKDGWQRCHSVGSLEPRLESAARCCSSSSRGRRGGLGTSRADFEGPRISGLPIWGRGRLFPSASLCPASSFLPCWAS